MEVVANLAEEIQKVGKDTANPGDTPVPPSENGDEEKGGGGKKHRKWHERTTLAKIKGWEKLPTFAGKREEFVTFEKKTMNFFTDEPGLRGIVREVIRDHGEQEITEEVIRVIQNKHDDETISVKAYSEQLHTFLTQVTFDTAFDLVDGVNVGGEDTNVLEAWRQLHQQYAPEIPEDKRNLVKKITHPEVRAKNYEDILQAQTIWERSVNRYTELAKQAGTTNLPEDVLITGYSSI